jgi:hypothetical protein
MIFYDQEGGGGRDSQYGQVLNFVSFITITCVGERCIKIDVKTIDLNNNPVSCYQSKDI